MAAAATCNAAITARQGGPVQRLTLRMPDDFTFRPGQYLEVVHPDGPIPLSIASSPRRLPELHLHYQSTPGVAEATRMDELLARTDTLTIQGPGGTVSLPEPLAAPVLLVAGGTGIAQAMSFIDHFAGAAPAVPVTVLWCAEQQDDFYLRAELEALQLPWLHMVLIADPERSADNRAMAWLREHSREHIDANSAVIVAGAPGFVYNACDALAAAGVEPSQLRSDVFSYAPR